MSVQRRRRRKAFALLQAVVGQRVAAGGVLAEAAAPCVFLKQDGPGLPGLHNTAAASPAPEYLGYPLKPPAHLPQARAPAVLHAVLNRVQAQLRVRQVARLLSRLRDEQREERGRMRLAAGVGEAGWLAEGSTIRTLPTTRAALAPPTQGAAHLPTCARANCRTISASPSASSLSVR